MYLVIVKTKLVATATGIMPFSWVAGSCFIIVTRLLTIFKGGICFLQNLFFFINSLNIYFSVTYTHIISSDYTRYF